MPFLFTETKLKGVFYVEPEVFGDERGSFAELYKQSEFAANGFTKPIVQVNHSRSMKNVIRALHYQNEPKAQGKLVFCTQGEVFDVAVDIRQGSPTYGEWVGKILTAANRNALYVPPGFAHGFGVLSDQADFMYFVSHSEYVPEYEAGILWNDPAIGIEWPIVKPVLRPRDEAYPTLAEAKHNFKYHE
jgi:dTDP-4-dehydrorhamnose 3,5-epimerase